MKTVKIVLAIWCICAFATQAQAGDVTMAWDPNTEPDLAGYVLYWGIASRNYTYSDDVGNNTTHTMSGLNPGEMNYIAVTAYDLDGNESNYSQEIAYALPMPDTDGDGLTDDIENQIGTDLNLMDTDNDDLDDGFEFSLWGASLDSDNDGIPNILDDDSDNDGWKDGQEIAQGTDPTDPNSKPPVPAQVNGLQGENDGNQVRLWWEPVDDADGYVVLYSYVPNAPNPFELPPTTTPEATLPSPWEQTDTYNKVLAFNMSGDGAVSTEILVPKYVPPQPIQVQGVDGHYLSPHYIVTWNAVPGAEGYKIYYSYSPNAPGPMVLYANANETSKLIFYGAYYPSLYFSVSYLIGGVEVAGSRSVEVSR